MVKSPVTDRSGREREKDRIMVKVSAAERAGATELNLNYSHLQSVPHALVQSHYCRYNIQKLYLKGNIIRELSMHQLQLMRNLKELYLHSNSLEHLPTELSNLRSLEVLNVACNKLTSLPASIGIMTHLRRIDFTQNKISNIPDEIWAAPNLEKLTGASNELSALSPSIVACQSLHTLILDKNLLPELPLQLTRLLNLTYLSVCGNRLTSLPSDFSALPKLKVVYVDGNRCLYCIPASLAGIQSLGVQSCNVSFSHHVNRLVKGKDEHEEGKSGSCCVLKMKAPHEPVPSLMEIAAKTLHRNLRGISPQLPWSLLTLFPYTPTSLLPWLVPRGRCFSSSCTRVFFNHHYSYLVSGLTFQGVTSAHNHTLPRDVSVCLDFCSQHCAHTVLSLLKPYDEV